MHSPPVVPTAFLSKEVQGTIAEQTIILPLHIRMTREKHTLLVAKKPMTMLHMNRLTRSKFSHSIFLIIIMPKSNIAKVNI